MEAWSMVFLEIFEDVPDPRDFNATHDLGDILFVAFSAMLCGAVDCTGMAVFAETRLELLKQFVPLRGDAPSHNTFTRVFNMLDPAPFAAALRRFAAAFGDEARRDAHPRQLAVDGKSLRRAYAKGRAHMPPLVVTVLDCDTFMSLAQAVAEKGGEADAAIAALQILALEGCIVSADALHCHRRMTKTVRDRGGHYVLAIKGNQSKLAKQAKAALDAALDNPKTRLHETEGHAHGRHERRRAFIVPFAQTPGKNALVDLAAVARVEAWRTVGETTTHKVRTYALSKRLPPEQVLRVVRKHWSIENGLHWQLDVLLDEDLTRNRKHNGPAVLAAMRRLVLNVLRADPQEIPLSHKRLKAGWQPEHLLRLLTHMR
jgi:predicted transposase YbfD/YdcC